MSVRGGDPTPPEPGAALSAVFRTATPEQVASMRLIFDAIQRGEPCTLELCCDGCGQPFSVSAYVRGLEASHCAECLQRFRSGTARRSEWAYLSPPEEFRAANLEGLSHGRGEVGDAVAAWLGDGAPQWCLVLSGPPGCGKTWTTWAIVREWPGTGRSLRVDHLTAYDLVAEIRSAWGTKSGVAGDNRQSRYSAPRSVLVLDDLSSDKLQRDGVRELFSILDRRWAWQQPTVITTNDDRETFYDLVGPSLASRIIGSGRWVDFPPIDRRARSS